MLQQEAYEAAVEAQVLEDAESESESEEVKYERSKTSGKKAEGFQIETLDGKVLIPLPPLIECHKIMNNRRCTRGGQVESKRWAIMFCCISSRAVHAEVIESMDASSCNKRSQAVLCTQRPCETAPFRLR
ncbi:hypothetical protein QTP86_019108 [Hemibagrus guttatus]|nr:hypothetical protein QTP86_019108 [Hemibagrus guttatus]